MTPLPPAVSPAISVIVPALNEGRYLPVLLDSLEKQDFSDYEVIVADAGSTDGTVECALSRNCRVVSGGMPGAGRNAGAAVARGEFFFFIDADVRLPLGFLRNAHEEIERRFIDFATCEIRPLSEVSLDKLLFSFASTITRLTLRTEPRSSGFCLIASRRLFRRVGGFDETIRLGEDHAFGKAAVKYRPLEFLSSVWADVSVRRLEKEGRLAYALKAIQTDLHRRWVGEIRDDFIEYEFAHYDEPPVSAEEAPSETILAKLDRFLLSADEGISTLIANARSRDADPAKGEGEADQALLRDRLQSQFRQISVQLRRRLRRRKRKDP
ncbi:Glycosyltransferase involved in cell wall bisynthesis [Alkalispirochaeta americana]|uniref:Glycosyltransferase involved in cell wall bisynthesis n=1 Tax=Alkalispirochaeta americana TaxID=159291 RepID=A0A1N6TUB5_9SPIO|nr:glycosyltransferase [Alkalispirochaeta americana]SIQ56995.1 Glycosyltransferase involved in cell wall bisynthesis [Alkalispirochaeta americana]